MRTGGNVDLFLTEIMRKGKKDEYLFHFLMPCGDGYFPYKDRVTQTPYRTRDLGTSVVQKVL